VRRRRTRVIVTASAAVVIVASLVLARALSLSNDRDGFLAVAQAGLFVLFAVAALTLFAAVVMDFDRWVDTVRPVPKRLARRWVGRGVRRICRVVAWVLALYGAVMTWTWSTIGGALGGVMGRAGSALLWLWVWVGRALSWALGRASVGLTVLWAWLARAGEWLLVRYRLGAGWVWSSSGRALARGLDRSGAGLTVLWAWLARAGIAALVLYRSALRALWSTVGGAVVWMLARIGAALTWLWSLITRSVEGFLVVSRSVMRRSWRAVAGREGEAPRKPLRRWYGAAVDSAFGIPPEGASLDPVRFRRASRRAMPANRPRSGRPAFLDEASPDPARARANAAVLEDPRARYVGRQVTRRGQRRPTEELLADALDRYRSTEDRSRDQGDRRDS
jgi:hypothetical protein